jgi:hypothetical protein
MATIPQKRHTFAGRSILPWGPGRCSKATPKWGLSLRKAGDFPCFVTLWTAGRFDSFGCLAGEGQTPFRIGTNFQLNNDLAARTSSDGFTTAVRVQVAPGWGVGVELTDRPPARVAGGGARFHAAGATVPRVGCA